MNNKYFYVVIFLCMMSTSNASITSYIASSAAAVGSVVKSFLGYEETRSAQTHLKEHNDTLKKQLDFSNGQLEQLGQMHKEVGSMGVSHLGELVDVQKETNSILQKGLELGGNIFHGAQVLGSFYAATKVVKFGCAVVDTSRKTLFPTEEERKDKEIASQSRNDLLDILKAKNTFNKCVLQNSAGWVDLDKIPEACKQSHAAYLLLSGKKIARKN